VGVALYALLRPRPPAADAPVEVPAPDSQTPAVRPAPTLSTGTLVVRVRTADGAPLPEDAEAGYVAGRDPRLRRVTEGIARYSDVALAPGAPQTRIEALARAPGYFPASAEVYVRPGEPAEVVITLQRSP
jgi:hypothetical protein